MEFMIRKFVSRFLAIFLFTCPFFLFANSNKISIEYYYQPNCRECREIQQLILPAITDEIGDKFVLEKYDLSIKANFIRLIAVLDRLKEDSNHPVYMIVNGKRCLGGLKNIQELTISRTICFIKSFLRNPAKTLFHAPSDSAGAPGVFRA